ncbi:MAG: hypothetical protein J6I98_02935 [Clostridia bacterium]|nr:hypothetical protein [Clostridia bacterium]
MVSIVAYNYGARDLQRAYGAIKWALIYGVSIYAVLMLFLEFFPQLPLQLFDASDAMLQMGTTALRIMAFSVLISLPSIVLSASFQGFGCSTYSMCITLMRQTVLLFIFLTVFKSFGNVNLLWWAFVCCELLGLPVSFFLYGKLRKNVTAEIEGK